MIYTLQSKQIEDYQKIGTIGFSLNDNGVLLVDSDSNELLASISMSKTIYDSTKVDKLFKIEFEEFVDAPTVETTVPSLVVNREYQNQIDSLKTELNSKISRISSLEETAALTDSQKATIIDLRIKLKQGLVESDFHSEFPYLPIDLTKLIEANINV